MNDLVGKQMYGFRFKRSNLHYSKNMEQCVGKIGTIILYDHYEDDDGNSFDTYRVQFENGEVWSYPYPEVFENLVDDGKTIEQIIIEVKQLTSELWKTKI